MAIGEFGFDLCEALLLFDAISGAMGDPLAAIDLFDNQIDWFGVAALGGEIDALIALLIWFKPLEADDLRDSGGDGVAVA